MKRHRNRASDTTEAEAAVWLARLQSNTRTEETDRAFHSWLKRDAHRAAFEKASEIWDILPGAVNCALPAEPGRPRFRRFLSLAFVVASAGVAAFLIGYFWTAPLPVYETQVGQQQSVTLEDGTRIALNTNSSVTVNYAAHTREVRLDRGEAMFEVSKDASRPFIVSSEDKQIRALGTRFVVREDPQRMAVTLLEGSVEVSRLADDKPIPVAVLVPGERITLVGKGGAMLDRPALDVLTAWRGGQVIFDDVMLVDAANEFNRYVTEPWVVMDPAVAALRISGVFSTRDPGDFAATIADLHGLHVERRGKEIRVYRPTRPSPAE